MNIIDNPPPLPSPRRIDCGIMFFSEEDYRAGEAAAFARGVAAGQEAMQEEIARLKDDLRFVERWAVHHGTKPHMTAQEALSFIQHYPPIKEITKSYADGVIPNTYDPFAEIDELRAKLKALEEKTPVEGVVFCSINGPMRVPRGMEESMCNEEVPRFRLYRAAGEKHD